MLCIVESYHCMPFQGRLMNQTWENDQKPSFRADFGPTLHPENFFRRFYLYLILYIVASYHCMLFQGKLMNQPWENGRKPSFGPNAGPFGPNLGSQFFFSKIWLHQSPDVMVSCHHVRYQKRLTIQSWENLVMDRQTNGKTDESDFTGCRLANAERPIIKQSSLFLNYIICNRIYHNLKT